ncbi:Stk1 family PASTA domain-containing Ser/Thr kinase [Actinomadura xylanilytica]|uniref:Stk1 family PASTA domain-containing Ser/Thr kinase n=1 Tax=Actinomadura xylanilytica TaxID=887459 RepID=UPI00255AEE54|nr:Stk1 family PASTA domain-containing Ser/Thr kinase [Actinomadura xylanilytica]MDL4771151.1 Stk1 family PASTA domain-containing Ser/Thr kinase [Actinomadura xylanilytica]
MDTTVADPLVGRVLDGRYRIESRIARGGMATVYVARDIRLDRVVAIKVMHPGLASDDDFVARFIGEAKAAAALSHPNVVAVYDQRTDGEHVFLVMEYVPGRTLRDLLAERGRLGPRAALEVMQPVLAALGAAHRGGLVHRDVKPENVLITRDGQVKVADFGLARAESASKMTKTGLIIGTVGYLSPEQVTSGNADVRSDVYAAGVLLFELLTGYLPHRGESPLSVAFKHVNEVVPAPSTAVPGLPPQVDALVTRATAKDPAHRPQDANQFLAEVAEVHGGLAPDLDQRLEEASHNATAVLEAPAPTLAGGGARTAVFDPSATYAPSAAYGPPGGTAPPPPRGTGDRMLGAATGKYVLIAIGAIAAVILGWAIWYQTSGQYDHVPEQIVGMRLADAREQLEGGGLEVRVAGKVFSDRVRKGEVVKSDPPAGARVAKGQTVTLTPSKGRAPKDVPDVGGKSADDARRALEKEGFTVGRTSTAASQTVGKDLVVRTDPPAGEQQSPDEPVDLVVSTGMSMPGLIDTNGDEAANRLRSMGLDVKVDKRDGGGKPPNVVLSQDPQPGTGVSRGDKVTLVVSKRNCAFDAGPIQLGCDDDGGGAAAVPVPNTVGQKVQEARKALESSGFQVNVTGFGGNTVRLQTPGGGEAPRGSTVTLVRGP